MTIKIWVFVLILVVALAIGYFAGKSMAKPALAEAPSAESPAEPLASPGLAKKK